MLTADEADGLQNGVEDRDAVRPHTTASPSSVNDLARNSAPVVAATREQPHRIAVPADLER
jgi:hypothetical protein